MKFKPSTEKYDFNKDALVKSYPDYLRIPIAEWIQELLLEAQAWKYKNGIYGGTEMESRFLNELNVHFREHFPRELSGFINFIFESEDRLTNVIALCLQNFATTSWASKLERILAVGGSAYKVTLTSAYPNTYDRGVADLTERIPEVVQQAVDKVIETEVLIRDAWLSCYSRNPDYAKAVGKCVDALEGLLQSRYFPADKKPSLGKFIQNLKTKPDRLSFKGDNLLKQKDQITNLAEQFIPIRGHHTSGGDGRNPTKDEAEFVLHYTIFLFSIHN